MPKKNKKPRPSLIQPSSIQTLANLGMLPPDPCPADLHGLDPKLLQAALICRHTPSQLAAKCSTWNNAPQCSTWNIDPNSPDSTNVPRGTSNDQEQPMTPNPKDRPRLGRGISSLLSPTATPSRESKVSNWSRLA